MIGMEHPKVSKKQEHEILVEETTRRAQDLLDIDKKLNGLKNQVI